MVRAAGRRDLAQPPAIAAHDPDLEALVTAAVTKEGEPLPVRRPPRRHRSIARVGELVDPVSADRCDADLIGAAAVPRDGDLTAIGREIDPAMAKVDLRRSDEILDRDVVEAGTERDRPEA